jgi:acetyl/propionyl-CoA carboxylase alpha subunit
MIKILSHTIYISVRSNQAFLQACLLHPKFQDPEYSTSFIPDLMQSLLENLYVSNLAETTKLLAFAVSLHHRTTHIASRSGPFSSISHRFQNQKRDLANVQADIVEAPSQSNQAFIVEWPSQPSQLRETRLRTVNIRPLLAPEESEVTPGGAEASSIILARKYNRLSSQVKNITRSTDAATRHQARIETRKHVLFQQTSVLTWDLRDFVLEIDSQRYLVYTAIGSTLSGFGCWWAPEILRAHSCSGYKC